jgi:hypothetical protein
MTMLNDIRLMVLASTLMVTLSANTEPTEDYSLGALRGARTVWFNFAESGDLKCDYRHDLKERALPMLAELKQFGLEVKDEIPAVINVLPDLTVLVSVEATSSKGTLPNNDCAIFIKLEAFHSMLGTLRYQAFPTSLRVLAYRTVHYGIAARENVESRLHETALHAVALFAKEYILANNRKNSD